MTKPTGRPRGRPKEKEYDTLMARVPQALIDEVKRYAGRKQQTISVVIREGLHMLVADADSVPHFVYDRNAETEKVSDVKAEDSPKVSDIKSSLLSDTKAGQATTRLSRQRAARSSDVHVDHAKHL